MNTYIENFTARIVYGYKKDDQGRVYVDESQADIVRLVYNQYLAGTSISGLVKYLAEQGIPSPTGKPKWAVKKVDDMLSDLKYVPHIISPQTFTAALDERSRRSNVEHDDDMNSKRKATRYNSQNVLSGLFVCGDCGASYRRITQSSGEVVWRCANRVEHGKQICSQSPTLKESDLVEYLRDITNTEAFDSETVGAQIAAITVAIDGQLTPTFKQVQALSLKKQRYQ